VFAQTLAVAGDFDHDGMVQQPIEALRTLRMLRHAAWLARRWEAPGLFDCVPVVRQPALPGRTDSEPAGATGGDAGVCSDPQLSGALEPA